MPTRSAAGPAAHAARAAGPGEARVMPCQARAIAAIEEQVIACRFCPELVVYREEVAREKRRAYRDQTYWGKPVPAFGDPLAQVVLVGLAPGAHGSNRTGRMFTGDASGEWLYRALYGAGFANQARQVDRNDGMVLTNALITAAVRCAPPGNKPSIGERAACLPYLKAEFAALRDVRVIVTLGKIADDTVHRIVKTSGSYRSPRAAFKHGAETRIALPGSPAATVLASYHPSRQNTNTGVLTEAMLDATFARARALAAAPG
jgi:uracil-DNA glycosylase family 4